MAAGFEDCSCVSNCVVLTTSGSALCYCDRSCLTFNDCCPDIIEICRQGKMPYTRFGTLHVSVADFTERF